ncbi:MAG: type II toxin-antitoxin system RelE/ParE family toxin [Candidatus Poribacteria bacterium]|nr:type II toxin-antitoxin system RelE/ParE family toxin [Candidatus Poribacteria bacterium]MDE0556113.1 type II toxin-antitoxin system RelE/ParE family toxin [Candidatus Poribacteria bacterium]MXY26949.1 type II toxin-antitoxin system RelE/ParE family toxin [Candidatus Poribacteria bacterium]MYK20210.1 type II toxin-antitoxin system RelE/ParE family toxin [Candidatus Poribacteria bacterium]
MIEIYRSRNGREPFTEWLNTIRDRKTQRRIRTRLASLKLGNFGNYKSVGEGVFELRFHFGVGYRIYFGEVNNAVVLLLCGGDKSSQTRDIERAKTYWLEYKEMHP